MLTICFAIKGHHENIIGFTVLNGWTWWSLNSSSVWSFGLNIDPSSSRTWEVIVYVLHTVPALSDSEITDVPQYPIYAVAWNRISEVIADLEKRQIITRTQFQCNSPFWLLQEPDGRWCIDCLCLNANTVAVPNTENFAKLLCKQLHTHGWQPYM